MQGIVSFSLTISSIILVFLVIVFTMGVIAVLIRMGLQTTFFCIPLLLLERLLKNFNQANKAGSSRLPISHVFETC